MAESELVLSIFVAIDPINFPGRERRVFVQRFLRKLPANHQALRSLFQGSDRNN